MVKVINITVVKWTGTEWIENMVQKLIDKGSTFKVEGNLLKIWGDISVDELNCSTYSDYEIIGIEPEFYYQAGEQN